jgi:hypothetical protein
VSALALVISLNVQRRDLTAAQRAIVAARTLPLFEEAARKRQETGVSVDGEAGGRGRKKTSGQNCPEVLSAEQAGKPFKVSATYVKQAKALLADAPDLAVQVEACALSLANAYHDLQGRKQRSAQRDKAAERTAEFSEAISNGEMTIEEALRRIQDKADEEKRATRRSAGPRRSWWRWRGREAESHRSRVRPAGPRARGLTMKGREMLRCLICLLSGLAVCLAGALFFSTGHPAHVAIGCAFFAAGALGVGWQGWEAVKRLRQGERQK